MKIKVLYLSLLFLISSLSYSQESVKKSGIKEYYNKGKLYIYWGWNKSSYSNSDIYFNGKGYEFTLYDVVGTDRQTPFSSTYFIPTTMTIPQYNLRIGYYFHEKYSISIGNDHMKYVMKKDQIKKIDGYIKDTGGNYDKDYDQEELKLSVDFLKFEHTDGLNYENVELRRHERLAQFSNFTIDAFAGLGAGVYIPRTNVTLLEGKRYDEFNLAGYGFNAVLGGNLTFKGWLFMQVESKVGYVNLPHVRVSYDKSEYAQQHFNFFQYNIVFGANIKLNKKSGQ